MKKNYTALCATSAAILAATLSVPAFAANSGFMFSTAATTMDRKFRPSAAVGSDILLTNYSLSVGYKVNKNLTVSGNYLRSNSKITRGDGVNTKTEADTFGLTGIYKINSNVTAFGNYSRTAVDSNTQNLPGGSFFDFDLDINLYLAGVTFSKVVDNKYVFTLTPTISYADSDIEDYLIQSGGIPVAGTKDSVTTYSLTPNASYIHGKGVYSIGYTHNRRNSGEDKIYGKAKVGANYNINSTVRVGLSYAEDIARDDTDGKEFGINVTIKI
jgi:predicted porin